MALLNKPKLKKGEATKQKNSMSVDQAKAKILAVRNTKSGTSGGGTPQVATPQVSQRQPVTTSQPTAGKAVTSSLGMGLGITGSSFMNPQRSVSGGFGGGTGGSWGEPKLELSVIPGNKPGPMLVPSGTSQSTQQSLLTGPNFSDKALGGIANATTKAMQFTGMVNEQGTALNPTGVGINLALGGFGGALARGIGALGRGAAGLFRGGKVATKADDIARLGRGPVRPGARPTGPNTVRVPPRGTARPTPVPTGFSRLGNLAWKATKIGVGIGAVGAVGSGISSVVGPVTRNALPPAGSTPAGAEGATPTDAEGQTQGLDTFPMTRAAASTSPYSTFTQSFDSASFAGGGSSVSGGGGVTGGGSSGTGSMYGTALRGEPSSEQQAAAQARALELQRQQSGTAGIAPTPVGDQVDLAGLQEVKDRAKNLLDQYGAEATTMPEFKAAVQQMIAAGIQNLRALQPTPPEPVEETPEETAAYENMAPEEAFSVRQYMDDMRRSLGMPKLESQKADLMRQMTAVNQAYQSVIDQIKQNPNLPKGLAARRLTEQFEDQKFAISTIMSELDIIQDQIDSGNEQLSNARADLGLQLQYNAQVQSQEDKQYQRNMDKLGLMIESRAIGGMSDQEMRQWSAVTGISVGALKKLKENALDSEDEKAVEFQDDANGNLMMITYSKKNPLDKTVERIGSVKTATGGTSIGGAGGFSDMDLLANTVLGTGSVAKQERDFATYEALKAQDPKKAEEWLYGKVATGLNATQKNDFRVFGSVVDGADSALAKIQQFASSNPGVYASIYNKAAPYLTASRDQNYVKLMQEVTSIGNEYRNAIFGASLTGNEQTEGLKVVIGTNDDLPTIITKLQGLSELSQRIRQRIVLDAAGQIGTSLSDGGPGTITTAQQDAQYSMDDEMFNEVAGTQDSGGNTGYLSNLWNALLGR